MLTNELLIVSVKLPVLSDARKSESNILQKWDEETYPVSMAAVTYDGSIIKDDR